MLLELCDSLKLLIEMHTTLRQWCQVESDTKVCHFITDVTANTLNFTCETCRSKLIKAHASL